MVWTELFFHPLKRLIFGKKERVWVCFVIALFLIQNPMYVLLKPAPWGLTILPTYLLFMMIGLKLRERNAEEYLNRLSVPVAAAVTVLGLLFHFGLFLFNGNESYYRSEYGNRGLLDVYTVVLQVLVFVPATEGYKEGCKYLYEHFFAKGLIDQEGFTMDKKTYNSQNQGEVANIGVFMCWNSFDLGTVHEDEYEPLSPLLGPDGTTSWGTSPDSTMAATGFSITNVCKNPELLMQWVDTFYDPIQSMQCDLGPIGINIKDNGDGTYDYIDTPEGMSYDEFRGKDAFASDGPIALTSDFFGTKIPRSAGHQAKFDRNENYYRKYATSVYLPSMILSEEDTDDLNLIKTDIINYAEEMRAK